MSKQFSLTRENILFYFVTLLITEYIHYISLINSCKVKMSGTVPEIGGEQGYCELHWWLEYHIFRTIPYFTTIVKSRRYLCNCKKKKKKKGGKSLFKTITKSNKNLLNRFNLW